MEYNLQFNEDLLMTSLMSASYSKLGGKKKKSRIPKILV